MQSNLQLCVTNGDDWRSWLKENHATEKEIWLVFFKKHADKPSIPYEDAVEEALCFGWIDSIVRRIDDERYSRKFTPRKAGAVWSESNKTRVERMIRQGRMTEAGLAKITAAKRSGEWSTTPVSRELWGMPSELKEALAANEIARYNFESLAPSYQRQYIGWIASAKRSETRIKRAREALSLLEQNQQLGLK